MKTIKNIILMIAVPPLIMACGNGNDKNVSTFNEDSVNRIINQKDSEINNLLGTINEIQNGLRQITEAQGRINTLKNGSENSAKEDIRENIAFIQRIIELNREKMESLQRQIHNSNINVENLRQTIEGLQQQIEEKSAQIDKLTAELAAKDATIAKQTTQIADLNTEKTVLQQDRANLSQANEAKAQTISQQDRELNRAWYVFGTKKELKQHGILNNGDVLAHDYNKNYLTEVDIRNLKTIPLGSKNAKILTTHPAPSYRLERGSDKTYTLHITDPALFWNVSKYLVVLVT